jgi:hypothetical protein
MMTIIKKRSDGWGFKNATGSWTGQSKTLADARKQLKKWKPTTSQLFRLGSVKKNDTLQIRGRGWTQRVTVYDIVGSTLLVNFAGKRRVPIADAFRIMRGKGSSGWHNMQQIFHEPSGKTFEQLREEHMLTETKQEAAVMDEAPEQNNAPEPKDPVQEIKENLVTTADLAASAALVNFLEEEKSNLQSCRADMAEAIIKILESLTHTGRRII